MRVWISDNDLHKLAESVGEVRNIRMSKRRTHLRVHAVEIPALDELVANAGAQHRDMTPMQTRPDLRGEN